MEFTQRLDTNRRRHHHQHYRIRRYYRLTPKGKGLLVKKQAEWTQYAQAVSRVMEGSAGYAFA
jgi:DNA-binding PadR family transcriptional regulator